MATAKFVIKAPVPVNDLSLDEFKEILTTMAPLAELIDTDVLEVAAGDKISILKNVPRWSAKITKTKTDFSAAALTKQVTIFTLPAGAVVHAVLMKHTASFAGGAIATYTMSVGNAGTPAKYAGAFNVFQAPGTTVQQVSGTIGTEDRANAVAVIAQATSTGANLDQATTGSCDFWVLWSTPAL